MLWLFCFRFQFSSYLAYIGMFIVCSFALGCKSAADCARAKTLLIAAATAVHNNVKFLELLLSDHSASHLLWWSPTGVHARGLFRLTARIKSHRVFCMQVIRGAERWGARHADAVIVLSAADKHLVSSKDWMPRQQPCHILPPAMRHDVAAIPPPNDVAGMLPPEGMAASSPLRSGAKAAGAGRAPDTPHHPATTGRVPEEAGSVADGVSSTPGENERAVDGVFSRPYQNRRVVDSTLSAPKETGSVVDSVPPTPDKQGCVVDGALPTIEENGRAVDGTLSNPHENRRAVDGALSVLEESTNSACNLQRRYLLCCVRLSPEKEPERFVALATELQARGAWAELAVTPYLVGPSKSAYAEDLKRRFREQVPAGIVQETFLGPRELAAVFAKTALNVHPCRYDAFGMTIVEAASQGAPSIMQEVRSEVSV